MTAKTALERYLNSEELIPAVTDIERFISTTSDMAKLVRCWEKASRHADVLVRRSIEQRMVEVVRDVSVNTIKKLPKWFLEVAKGNLGLPFTAFSLGEEFNAKAKAIIY